MFKLTTWEERLNFIRQLLLPTLKACWNVLTEGGDKQDLEDFQLDQGVQVLGGIIL